MKKLLFLLLPLLIAAKLPAQNNPKNEIQTAVEIIKKDIADLEKQIADAKKKNNVNQMKDLQQELDMKNNMLSMMQGNMKSLGKVSDKDLQKVTIDNSSGIPKKDVARINTIPKKILSNAELAAFVNKVVTSVEKKLSSKAKENANAIYQEVKKRYNTPNNIANTANALWMTGDYQEALYLSGKACVEDYNNTDNLNNYAAFLTMTGAEQAALPILQNLNKKFPGNSTILNNIAQAWFGLGDIPTAEKYLDSTVKIFALHSQANYTRCLIEEKKGNKAGAIDALKKSIKKAYSTEKENKLRKLGADLDKNDLTWNLRMPQDPLGLDKFAPPPFYKSTNEQVGLAPLWKTYCDHIQQLYEELSAKEIALIKEADEINSKRSKSLTMAKFFNNPFYQKALFMQKKYAEDIDGSNGYMIIKMNEDERQMKETVKQFRQQYDKEVEKISEKYKDRGGEGSNNSDALEEQMCADKMAAANKYLNEANDFLEKYYPERLRIIKRKLNTETYFAQYLSLDDVNFELAKVKAEKSFLNALPALDQKVIGSWPGIIPEVEICQLPEVDERTGGELPDFDEMHCEYKEEIKILFTTFTIECNTMETEMNFVVGEWKQKENLNTGEVIKGELELGIIKTLGAKNLGPLAAEIKVDAGVFIEYDNNGITDIGPKAGVSGQVGVEIPEKQDPLIINEHKQISIGEWPFKEDIGVSGRWGWNSGPSLEGKGLLGGMKIEL